MLYLDDWIVWDFWLAPRLSADEPFHCYFLQAPRSLADPEMRHDLARIGHATSFRSDRLVLSRRDPAARRARRMGRHDPMDRFGRAR